MILILKMFRNIVFTNENNNLNSGVVAFTSILVFIFARGFEWPSIKLVIMIVPNNSAKINGEKNMLISTKRTMNSLNKTKKLGLVTDAIILFKTKITSR